MAAPIHCTVCDDEDRRSRILDVALGQYTKTLALCQSSYSTGTVFCASTARCYERLTRYKVPKNYYEVDELPRSMLGKTLRRKVRESLEAKYS